MKYYVGLDVSNTYTNICVIDVKGKIIAESVVDTSVEKIHQYLKRLKLDFENIGIETGAYTNFLVKGLRSKKWPLTCICARKMSTLITSKNKTDKNDAKEIAQAVRAGYYKEVYLKSDEAVVTSLMLSARDLVVREQTKITNTIRGLLRPLGITSHKLKGNFEQKVVETIQELSPEIRFSITMLLELYRQVKEKVASFDDRLEEIASKDNDVKNLSTMDGVGNIVALAFKTVVDKPERFKKNKDIGAYLGLTSTLYESGNTSIKGKISKCGPSYLRSLMIKAAVSMLVSVRKKSKLKSWGHSICSKKGDKIGRVALARKMAVVMLSMMKSGKPFDRILKELEVSLQGA